jgi:hypothetical protein
MSTSTKSKPASPSSPATGVEAETEAPFRAEDKDRGPLESVEIELEGSRQRLISWTVFGIIFGALLVWRLGTVGVWTGWVLIALGLWRGYQLVLSYIYPAGTFIVTEKHVVLPRKLHRPNPLDVKPSEITAVYFLRRSVPMYHAAPVLVVELGKRALLYPRDWFPEEKDQRRLLQALMYHLPRQELSA